MVNQAQTLEILNREKNYEEKLSDDLTNFCIACLEHIKDMTEEEKQKAKITLNILLRETMQHKNLFNQLIEFVIENPEKTVIQSDGRIRKWSKILKLINISGLYY